MNEPNDEGQLPGAATDSKIPHTRCPIDHQTMSRQRTSRESSDTPTAIVRDAPGHYHVHGYAEAKAILRSPCTKQAGFQAEQLEKMPTTMRDPLLFQEGKAHREQRLKIARLFTPQATHERYREMMQQSVEEVLAPLTQSSSRTRTANEELRSFDVGELTLTLAVRVTGLIVGLTNSRSPGMASRIENFFDVPELSPGKRFNWLLRFWHFCKSQWHVARFYFADVRPAIAARHKAQKDDLISHLLSEGYGATEILVECVTFAAAGMVTTREFISACTWHLLENEPLRQRYQRGDEEQRHKILHEILRLEPVVGHLLRKVTKEFSISSGGETIHFKPGDSLTLHIYSINADERIVGDASRSVCPVRPMPRGVNDSVMGFGDGHHRCPGAYVAIQETDIFLQRLLALDSIALEHRPELSWNETVKGYELRALRVTN